VVFLANANSLADFKQPVGMNLKESNRWVKKAQTIPWPEIEKRYAALFTNRKGNVAKPLRLALGACIIQSECADDIVVLAKSERAAERLLESCRKYLEGRLKLKMNTEKSKVTSIFAQKKFKFLGFCLGRNGNGTYIRVHRKSLAKAKERLNLLTKRNRGRNVRRVMQEVKEFIRGWIGYFRAADMKRTLMSWDKLMRRRFRMYIWKQWKKPKTKVANLRKLGVPADKAYQWGNSRLGYWRIAGSHVLECSITNIRVGRN